MYKNKRNWLFFYPAHTFYPALLNNYPHHFTDKRCGLSIWFVSYGIRAVENLTTAAGMFKNSVTMYFWETMFFGRIFIM